jgi:hypothetical protein
MSTNDEERGTEMPSQAGSFYHYNIISNHK